LVVEGAKTSLRIMEKTSLRIMGKTSLMIKLKLEMIELVAVVNERAVFT
jgi:hypothetical protein